MGRSHVCAAFIFLCVLPVAARAAGEADKALAEARAAVATSPDSVDANLALCKALLDGYKYADAQALARKIIEKTPGSARAHRYLGEALKATDSYPAAIKELTAAASLDPKDAKTFDDLAIAYSNTHEEDKAAGAMRSAVALEPANSGYYTSLGLYLQDNHPAEALPAFLKAAELDAKDGFSARLASESYRALNDAPNALAWAKKAMERTPDDTSAHMNQIEILRYLGRWEEAHDAAVRAAKLANAKADTDMNASMSVRRFEQWMADVDSAHELFDHELGRSKANPLFALHADVAALINDDKFEQGAAALQKAIALDPSPSPYRDIAYAEFFAHHADKALAAIATWADKSGPAAWSSHQGQYVALLAAACELSLKHPDAAAEWTGRAARVDAKSWPASLAQLLAGTASVETMLKPLTKDDSDRLTEVHGYAALRLLFTGDAAGARAHMQWVAEHGNRNLIEYDMVVAWQK